MASALQNPLAQTAGMAKPADPIIAPVEIPTGVIDPWSPEARRERNKQVVAEYLKNKETSIIADIKPTTDKADGTKFETKHVASDEIPSDAPIPVEAAKGIVPEVAFDKAMKNGAQPNGQVEKKKPGRKPGPAAVKKAERVPKRAATETGEPRRSKRNRI